MKQQITKSQFLELSEKLRTKLALWSLDHHYHADELSIGQMIEYLGEDLSLEMNYGELDYCNGDVDKNLCDALFEAVKEKLKE